MYLQTMNQHPLREVEIRICEKDKKKADLDKTPNPVGVS
jgi:hypothetical protein